MLKRLVPLFLVVIGVAGIATAQCLIPQNLIVSGGLGDDGIPALTNPAVVPVETATTFLVPEDLVLGVVINGEARAYPARRAVVALDHQRRSRGPADPREFLPADGKRHRLRPHLERPAS